MPPLLIVGGGIKQSKENRLISPRSMFALEFNYYNNLFITHKCSTIENIRYTDKNSKYTETHVFKKTF